MNIKVKFFNHEWDNYQGAQGRVVIIKRAYKLPDNTKIEDIKNEVIKLISLEGYHDDWSKNNFTGRGIINISIL